MFDVAQKIISAEQAARWAAAWRLLSRPVVFTNGCFDLLHAGHVQYLQQAANLGQYLIVGLNDDASVQRLKGPKRPINTLKDRALVLAGLGFVAAVVPFGEDTPLSLIKLIRPDILAKGADYEIENIVGAKEVMGWGGRVERMPLLPGRSTTALIERLS
ncbi:MAG: D-glycero-beta-D-manno-heptose 1-phosphate adenylyltransferase [Bacteroidetes bacterium]|jgi:rfaE bifunctional protein nucleotidyltransferase chain/domain|nr:D-glycero-beta-D-manno-heptose 1-phosphate adenylyltransferase [Bacteroidota bacterium]